jgi:hypothetical protein
MSPTLPMNPSEPESTFVARVPAVAAICRARGDGKPPRDGCSPGCSGVISTLGSAGAG